MFKKELKKYNKESIDKLKNDGSQGKFWMFTINNPLCDEFQNIPCQYMIWQLEIGNEEETIHVQGYICYETNQRFNKVIKDFYQYSGHWVQIQLRRGKHSEAKGYCSKVDTRIDGPFEIGSDKDVAEGKGVRSDLIDIRNNIDNGISLIQNWSSHFSSFTRYYKSFLEYEKLRKIEKNLKEYFDDSKIKNELDLYTWQKKILDQILIQDDRKIKFIVDIKGGKGKSEFAKYLEYKYHAFRCSGGLVKDIANAYDYEPIIIFDLTRQSLKNDESYAAMEMFKSGCIWDGKYHSSMKKFSKRIVIVFMNFQPNRDHLSKDRYDIEDITDIDLKK